MSRVKIVHRWNKSRVRNVITRLKVLVRRRAWGNALGEHMLNTNRVYLRCARRRLALMTRKKRRKIFYKDEQI